MVGNSATRLACEFQRTERRRHHEHETPTGRKKHGGPVAPRLTGPVTRYEQLRSDALSRGYGVASGIGLTVFLRQGLTAWMRACCSVVAPPTREFVQPGPVSSLPCDVRTQAVLILAGILL